VKDHDVSAATTYRRRRRSWRRRRSADGGDGRRGDAIGRSVATTVGRGDDASAGPDAGCGARLNDGQGRRTTNDLIGGDDLVAARTNGWRR
jgi:hypothetical protein